MKWNVYFHRKKIHVPPPPPPGEGEGETWILTGLWKKHDFCIDFLQSWVKNLKRCKYSLVYELVF